AAHLLAELRRRFGTLGNAAAAYNAGPARLEGWLHGQGDLPAVTHAYVRFVTQGGGDAATGGTPGDRAETALPQMESCLAVTAELRQDHGGSDELGFAPLMPWGVQLAGNFSKSLALAAFERAR